MKMDNMITTNIPLRLEDGKVIGASLQRRAQDTTCWLLLVAEDIKETSTSTDYFEAFAIIRKRLARRGIFPLCYGASRNVWPSAMAREMGQGLKAYKLKLGEPGREIVEIFSTGTDIDSVTPEEQKSFASQWFQSLK